MTVRGAAPAQVGGHVAAHHEVVAPDLQEGVLGWVHADPGASSLLNLPRLTMMVRMHVGDQYGCDRGHGDLALSRSARQGLPAIRVVPAWVNHDETLVMLDEVAEHVPQRVIDDRYWHRPHSAGDFLDWRELLPLPCVALQRSGYLHSFGVPSSQPGRLRL